MHNREYEPKYTICVNGRGYTWTITNQGENGKPWLGVCDTLMLSAWRDDEEDLVENSEAVMQVAIGRVEPCQTS